MTGLEHSPDEYYEDVDLHGSYQYVTLKDIINSFMVRYVGDNEEINNVARHRVLFEAKRGLKELTYDALKEIKKFEIELDDSLEVILPHDYVNYARISWVNEKGDLVPLIESTDTGIINAYLQDNNYNILFNSDGFPLEGTSDTTKNQYSNNSDNKGYKIDRSYCDKSAKYGLDTSRARSGGYFMISDTKIRFSTDVPSKNIVIEYVSDGLESENPNKIRVHKFAERALYAFIKYEILNNRIDTTEYRIRRAKKDYLKERQNAKIRLANIKPHQFIQRLKGRNKWLK